MPLKHLLILISFIPLFTQAQQADAVLSKFFATPLDETVFLRWTISAGNTCNDTYVERSTDGISYDRIGLIGGICGSPDQSITYEFTDTLPLFNRKSFYRLELGYYGYSSPQTVEIKRYNDQGFLLAPNPFRDLATLSFTNETGEEFKLIITDMQGRVVEEKKTAGKDFTIKILGLPAGIYFFRIFQSDQVLYTGKLIKN
jgi:hypothetical protein